MNLQHFFAEHNKVALGFSGGVDSSYLLYAAKQYGAEIQPYFVKTAFQPAFELADAEAIAAQVGVKMQVLHLDIFCHPMVISNNAMRCYHCKQQIFGAIVKRAKADGYTVLIDGTNASDDANDRPGMRALQELQVLSPLRMCGIIKSEVRQLSKEAGLFTWNKPAYACLATRIPTNTAITQEALANVEQAEAVMTSFGFSDFRVRLDDGQGAKLQIPKSQFPRMLLLQEEVKNALLPFFTSITLDLQPR